MTLSLKEAEEKTGIRSGTFSHWLKVGRLKGHKVPRPGFPGQDVWAIEESDLEEALATRSQQSLKMQEVRSQKSWGPYSYAERNGGELRVSELPLDQENDALLTVDEATEVLGVSQSTMYKWAARGLLGSSATQTESGRWLFSRNGLERFAEDRKNGGTAHASNGHSNGNGSMPSRPSVQEAMDRVDVALRELKYAIAREARGRRKDAQEAFQKALEQL
jgi:excisionase family DNA binding protein